MNKTGVRALLPLFLCLAVSLTAGGKKEAPPIVVQVSGRVRLVGSGALPELVITGEEAEWYIDREDEGKLRDLQHRTVRVEGVETIKTLTLANGRSSMTRRILKDIKIISVE